MGKSRRQDMARDRDTLQKLKATIRKLTKENAQLRRELERRANVADDYQELLDYEVERERQAQTEKLACPKCGSDVGEFQFDKFRLRRCKSKFCTWREKLK